MMLDADRHQKQEQLEFAAEVHQSLLPKPLRHKAIDVDLRYLSVDEVGGDYCQVRVPGEESCYITICDVTGHGIHAALLATRVSSEVRHRILDHVSPRNIVERLNQFIIEHFAKTGLYLTFFVTRINLELREITWSGTGHPPPLLIRKENNAVEQLVSQNLMIGVLADVIETEDHHGMMIGIAGLSDLCVKAMSVDIFQMADFILDRVTLFQQGEATDDKNPNRCRNQVVAFWSCAVNQR